MRYYLLLSFIFLIAQTGFAQQTPAEEKTEPEKTETTEKADEKADEKAKKKAEKTKAPKEKTPKEKVPYRFMANVHGGVGLMNYFGDIRDKQGATVHRVGNRAGYNFGIGGNFTNWLDFNINVLMGSVTWNQNVSLHNKDGNQPKNFEAEVFTAGLNLVYNFKNVIRDPIGITPFISVGVSYSDFDVYTDRQDAEGNVYYYWEDGLIRNVDEFSPATDNIYIVERDYEYETRENEFPIVAVSVPVGAGFDFNASRKLAIRAGVHYYFTTTDGIDGVSEKQEDGKIGKGAFGQDGFLYSSLSLIFKFDPFKKKAKNLGVTEDGYDLGILEEEDSDGDGVSDFFDRCGGTPKGLPVDKYGCPADDDQDGIPNYRDKQLNTPAGAIVTPNGVAISYKEIYETYGSDTGSIKRSEVDEDWLFSQPDYDAKYTVHVGTYTNYDIPTQLKQRLSRMEGLVERKINDSVSVFTLGLFDDFESAEKKQNELIKSGIDDAFGVKEKSVTKVADKLSLVNLPKQGEQQQANIGIENVDVLSYGVELKEYRLRIQLDKLSRLIAKHGVEMVTTTGGLKIYTIGAFKTFAEAEALRAEVISLGVKNPEISAKFNNVRIEIDKAREIEQSNSGAGE